MRILLLFPFCLLGFLLVAQSTIEVSYYTPQQDANGDYLEAAQYYTLTCNQESSLFLKSTSEDVVDYDEASQKMAVNFAGGKNWIYKNNQSQLLTNYVTSFQEKHFLIEDQLHPMHWEILPEQKNRNGVLVQKARGAHRGRTYTAWFAPSIPINNGPWKLGGLPGLILEAYDDEKEVVFLFKSLQQIHNPSIRKPKSKGRKVSLATYLELAEKEYRQYLDFLEGRLKSTGSTIDIDANFTKFSSWEYLK